MICCRECLELLNDYIDGSLDPEVKESLEEHLKDCPPCIAFLNTYKSTTEITSKTLSEIEIPAVVQEKLREFVTQTLKDQKK
ncbi:MAG: zf-HC2 domain-containing protein [Candidatus Nitronauta litoralis]|uniref:Zf-HC2 domain-containing protein n=1 Tax=Candidatus Nitronauta litoralis TaxID=2705533 RepID=A0A7T0BVU6_9BACT|nr:MAG: zf-HC2 domain-containing protein [Candidatus Nitronauta litoralis]